MIGPQTTTTAVDDTLMIGPQTTSTAVDDTLMIGPQTTSTAVDDTLMIGPQTITNDDTILTQTTKAETPTACGTDETWSTTTEKISSARGK